MKTLEEAKARYEQAQVDYYHAPTGNALIDTDIKATYEEAKKEYKDALIKTITALAEELGEL